MRILTLAAIASAIAISPASAGQLEFAWGNCLDQGGTLETTLPCGSPTDTTTLFITYTPSATIQDVQAIDYQIQMEFDGDCPNYWDSTLPECTSFGATCTGGASCLGAEPVFEGCTYPFQGFTPRFGCSRPRAAIVGSVLAPELSGHHLQSGQRYVVAAIHVTTAHTTESGGQCTGCPTPVAFGKTYWDEGHYPRYTDIKIFAASGFVQEFYEGPCLSANGGASLCDQTTDAQPVTWGKLKIIYR